MFAVAHHYDADFDRWCHLVDAYAVDRVFVIGLPADAVRKKWESISSVEEIDLPRFAFQPQNGPRFAGTVSLADFEHPKDGCYVFGNDNGHAGPFECEACIYVPTPIVKNPLYASQAALIALHDRWGRRG